MTLKLAKEVFKLSAAHFLVFDETRAERLHGHNYYLSLEIELPLPQTSTTGFYKDFGYFKRCISEELEKYDEYVWLPGEHPEMKIQTTGTQLEMTFRDRFYSFPKNEVLVLPLKNICVEEMARFFVARFWEIFADDAVTRLAVTVEETRGQAAMFSKTRST